jgi:hypothetical protein
MNEKISRSKSTLNRKDESPMVNIVRLDLDEAVIVIRFKKLCIEKLGQRFQRDKNFRHQAVDALLIAIENIGL